MQTPAHIPNTVETQLVKIATSDAFFVFVDVSPLLHLGRNNKCALEGRGAKGTCRTYLGEICPRQIENEEMDCLMLQEIESNET